MLTITIPIYEEPALVEKMINENMGIFTKYPLVIINKSGGDKFKEVQKDITFIDQDSKWWEARKYALEFVKTKYVLCLDLDTALPPHYIEDALCILEARSEVVCIAINYENPHHQNHLAFGTSIWRTDVLRKLYDWEFKKGQSCECRYMWNKVEEERMKIETLSLEAKHIRFLQRHFNGNWTLPKDTTVTIKNSWDPKE